MGFGEGNFQALHDSIELDQKKRRALTPPVFGRGPGLLGGDVHGRTEGIADLTERMMPAEV